MASVMPSRMAQNQLWGSKTADKKMTSKVELACRGCSMLLVVGEVGVG